MKARHRNRPPVSTQRRLLEHFVVGTPFRDAAGKVAISGLLKRHGRVYAVMIPNAGHQRLMSIIRKKVQANSIFYSDSWYAYDKLDVSNFHHERIDHSRLSCPG